LREGQQRFFYFYHLPLTYSPLTNSLIYNLVMDLDATLNLLASKPEAAVDLAEIALKLAQDEYADLDVEAYLSQLTAMAHESKRYLTGNLEARVAGLCRYLFHDMGFRGNVQNYYDPRNSYLNEVLERRTGIPITLSMVVIAVGSGAGLQIAGVGLPGHFIVKALDRNQEVLFDPFHGGRQLTPQECENVVEQATGQPFHIPSDSLHATPPALIVQRMLTNLKNIYLNAKDLPRAIRVIERILQLRPQDATERRDLGICLIQSGRYGPAIDHLSAYLTSAPPNGDDSIRRLLEQAKAEVARWN
jgi:regulator of sirC expression with transglutaminase-like and TPR domain